MTKEFKSNSETYQVIDKYLRDSLGFQLSKLTYAGTHSNEGLTPIVHYDVECSVRSGARSRATTSFRATVYWNNATTPPTITEMDVM